MDYRREDKEVTWKDRLSAKQRIRFLWRYFTLEWSGVESDDNQISCAAMGDFWTEELNGWFFTEDDCADLNQLGACIKSNINVCFFIVIWVTAVDP